MKSKTKIKFLVIALIPFIASCEGTLVGTAEKGPGCTEKADNVRIIITADNKTGCSGSDGVYSIPNLSANQQKEIIYRKAKYQTKKLSVNIENIDNNTVIPPDADCLSPADPLKEISGTVSWNRPGDPKDITITLSKLICGGWSVIDTVKTCMDGKYGFPDLEDFTYKVEASYPGCTFSNSCEESITRGTICDFQGS